MCLKMDDDYDLAHPARGSLLLASITHACMNMAERDQTCDVIFGIIFSLLSIQCCLCLVNPDLKNTCLSTQAALDHPVPILPEPDIIHYIFKKQHLQKKHQIPS